VDALMKLDLAAGVDVEIKLYERGRVGRPRGSQDKLFAVPSKDRKKGSTTMRSGVIAQKVGMTRVFTDAGEHIPVTVLKLGNCQVSASHGGEERLYVALQLGSGSRKTVYLPKAERGQFAVAKVEPKRKVAEFRVPKTR
jgi:hypothetical protein